MVKQTPYETIPPYLRAVTILKPEGNISAAVAIALKKLADSASTDTNFTDDRIFRTTTDALQVLHEFDNVIRTTLGPLTRFDHNWSSSRREEAISAIEKLADAEAILPRVRQALAQLTEESRNLVVVTPKGKKANVKVRACGRKVLASLSNSQVTPWPGPLELVNLTSAIRAAHTPDAAQSVIQCAMDVQSVVNRDCLGTADELIGQWRGAMKSPR